MRSIIFNEKHLDLSQINYFYISVRQEGKYCLRAKRIDNKSIKLTDYTTSIDGIANQYKQLALILRNNRCNFLGISSNVNVLVNLQNINLVSPKCKEGVFKKRYLEITFNNQARLNVAEDYTKRELEDLYFRIGEKVGSISDNFIM